MEDSHTKLVFELFDLAAERSLAHIQAKSRAGEVQLLSNHYYVSELS
jgi:hypothetical protein